MREWTFYEDCVHDSNGNLTYHNTGNHEHWFEFDEQNNNVYYKTSLVVPVSNKETMDADKPRGWWEFWKTYDSEGRILSYKDSDGDLHEYDYNGAECVRTVNGKICHGIILDRREQNGQMQG